MSASRLRPSVAQPRKLLAVLAVLTFYISLSAVWTFIGTIGGAGIDRRANWYGAGGRDGIRHYRRGRGGCAARGVRTG